MCLIFFVPTKAALTDYIFPQNGCYNIYYPSYSSRALTSMFSPMSLDGLLQAVPVQPSRSDATWF